MVYSNCPTVELFVNGVSAGTRTRKTQDFPAAGLWWMVARIDAEVVDACGLRCLDSRTILQFGVAGSGRLRENMGTMGGSRQIEVANGRAHIRLVRQGGPSVISVSAKDLPTTFLTVA